MKKILVILMLLSFIVSAFASCNQQKHKTVNVELRSVLEKYTKQKIVFLKKIKINGSQTAAFAIVAGEPNEGDVWYVTASDAQKLKSDLKFPQDNKPVTPEFWTVDQVVIFKCESDASGSGSASFAWYVKDGKPVMLPFTGENLCYQGNGQFITSDSAFDIDYTEGIGTGHTHKAYYLYWDNGLKEYGGLKMTKQQLLKVNGAQAIFDVITKSGYTIGEIYYRANNTISINYHKGDKNNGTFYNIILEYKNNTVISEMVYVDENSSSKTESLNDNNLNNFSVGGSYQAALFPTIATYPTQFPIS